MTTSCRTAGRGTRRSAAVGVCLVALAVIGPASNARCAEDATRDPISLGRELFAREWVPNDPRCHGGDGLGPAYNETSCLGCHNQGGPGGAGPVGKNVELLSLKPSSRASGRNSQAPEPKKPEEYHPGFRDASTLVLHRFGTDAEYRLWRLARVEGLDAADLARAGASSELQQVKATSKRNGRGPTLLVSPLDREALKRVLGRQPKPDPLLLSEVATLSQRNPPPLFGAGLIDSITPQDLKDAAAKQKRETPETAGRVNVLFNGHIGRFGWKAQISTLDDFVLSACANELGLETPGHRQAALPLADTPERRELDMTAAECDALIAYVSQLAAPAQRPSTAEVDRSRMNAGKRLFATIGCAGCHTSKLGSIDGIYSDLLLHDMGSELADNGMYYGRVPGRTTLPVEWRTPPLWGYRDSGPYLHDGRANTLEEAVAFHGGQSHQSAERFFELDARDRQLIQSFLNTLTAPRSDHAP